MYNDAIAAGSQCIYCAQTNSLQFNKIIKDAVLKLNIFIVLDKDKPDFVDNVCEHTVFVYEHTYFKDITYSYC
jgi:hypothetical protein